MQKGLLSGFVGIILASGSAQAQDAPFELQPVIVGTALRDDRDIRDTPVATSVISGEDLDRRQADTYEELIGDIPGVVIEGGPRGISQEPNIRGFQDEQVVLRFDGGRLNFNQAHRGRFFFDPDIVQRIEVVRGGGSTLFGSGAIGGVIAVETKDAADLLQPGQTTGARLRFGGSDNGDVLSPSATVYGDWGRFDALAFVGTRQFGTSLEDGDGNDILRSEIDSVNGLVKFGFEPNAEHRFELNLAYYDDEGVTPPNSNAASDPDEDVAREAEIFTGRLSWDWAPERSDLIDLSVLFYGNLLNISEDRLVDGRRDRTEYDTFGLEVVNRSSLDVGVPVDLVYGFEAVQDTQTGTRDGAPRTQFPDAEAETFGLFAEATVGVSDRWDVIAGARFDDYSRDVDDPSLEDVDERFFSPRIGVSFRPNETWQIYGNLARAYRAPTLTELYNDGEHFASDIFFPPFGPVRFVNNFVPNPDLEEERSTQVEFGARFERADIARPGDVLRFSANAYYAEVDNFIDTVVTGPDPTTFVPGFIFGTTTQRNVDAELYGIEAELDYDAGTWFGGLGLSIPRGKQSNGDALGSIPQERLVATLGYRPMSEVEVGLRATFASGQADVPDTASPGEAYRVLDVFGSWAPDNGPLEGAVLRAGIDNLLDEQYTIFPNDLAQPGRTLRLSVSYRF
ncbi:TonB-dependent receptor [Roseobacter cerasinus]|uniref:TonB-dependent receptor n=1 Tax=Roseobacter cerasinus TaxID=2602289 RepID=A0A640VWC9_9RHOB|nr:TonB-dependent hemoglobin/transferrin/lactoferrin family receptor [Roseobacter cerasinus]GFE51932.1 TonB-dependent receptor [Roseobacter cerasinus]